MSGNTCISENSRSITTKVVLATESWPCRLYPPLNKESMMFQINLACTPQRTPSSPTWASTRSESMSRMWIVQYQHPRQACLYPQESHLLDPKVLVDPNCCLSPKTLADPIYRLQNHVVSPQRPLHQQTNPADKEDCTPRGRGKWSRLQVPELSAQGDPRGKQVVLPRIIEDSNCRGIFHLSRQDIVRPRARSQLSWQLSKSSCPCPLDQQRGAGGNMRSAPKWLHPLNMKTYHFNSWEEGSYLVQTKRSASGLPLFSRKQVIWTSSPLKASSSNVSSGVPGGSG